MRKIIYISFFLLAVLTSAQAQDKKYVYQDSSLLQNEKETESGTEVIVQAPVEDKALETGIDTSLYANSLSVPADSIQSWRNMKAFAYSKNLDSLLKAERDKARGQKKEDPDDGFLYKLFSSPIFRLFLWGIAILFVLFIVYRLFLAKGVFRRGTKTTKSQAPQVEEEVITKESDFDALIGQALRDNNYRHAVRYQYLKTLHKLADRNFIELAPDKTNYQYVREISNGGLQNSFASLTLNYEYVWYGEFAIEKDIYQKIETDFSGFNHKL